MADQEHLTKIFNKMGYSDFRWVEPKEIVVAQWVRMKCMFGCDSYGKNASCPPNVPSIPDCRAFFDTYKIGAMLHFSALLPNHDDIQEWAKEINKGLVGLEREVFVAGHHKAFVLFVERCRFCRDCTNTRGACKNKKLARPSIEAMGVDVFATVAKYGFPIKVLPSNKHEIDKYALLLIE